MLIFSKRRFTTYWMGGRPKPARGCYSCRQKTRSFGLLSHFTVMSERPPPLQPLYLTPAIRAQVFASDNWCCRYCARKLVHPGILLLLGEIFPEFRGLKSGHHMPKETTEPAVVRVYPEVDHVNAVSLGGTWRDLDNLVAACTPCNELKNNYWVGPLFRA